MCVWGGGGGGRERERAHNKFVILVLKLVYGKMSMRSQPISHKAISVILVGFSQTSCCIPNSQQGNIRKIFSDELDHSKVPEQYCCILCEYSKRVIEKTAYYFPVPPPTTSTFHLENILK